MNVVEMGVECAPMSQSTSRETNNYKKDGINPKKNRILLT